MKKTNYASTWQKRYGHWHTPKLEAEVIAMRKLTGKGYFNLTDQILGAEQVLRKRRKLH